MLVEIHLDRLPRCLHADLEVGENDGIGERLQFAQPPVKRGLRCRHRRSMRCRARSRCRRAWSCRSCRWFGPASVFRCWPQLPRPRRRDCDSARTGIRSRTRRGGQILLAQRRELAEMGRAFDGAALKSKFLRGRIVVDRGVGVVDLCVEHLLGAPPRSREQIVALHYLDPERRFCHPWCLPLPPKRFKEGGLRQEAGANPGCPSRYVLRPCIQAGHA